MRIQGYRSIKDCEIALSNFQMMLGQNNCGKSNILRAIEFFFEGTSADIEDFNVDNAGHRTDELRITATFANLSEDERKEYKSYVLADNRVRITKIVKSVDSEVSKPEYHGVRLAPKDPRFRSSTYQGKPGEKFSKLEQEFGDISQYRPEGERTSDSLFDKTLENLVLAKGKELEFVEELEENQFMGWRNVASGRIGTFLLVPAIPDPDSEARIHKDSRLGELLSHVLERIATTSDRYAETIELLSRITSKMNKRKPDGSDNEERPPELSELESDIEGQLRDWDVGVELRIRPPDVKSILFQADIAIDDGYSSHLDQKGHGLQRAFLIAILNAWKNRLLSRKGDSSIEHSGLIVLAIEEPELYLHPQQQRALFDTLKEISKSKGHQVIVSSHSPVFIDVDNPLSILCVSKSSQNGTTIRQLRRHPFDGTENADRKKRFQLTQWINPTRGEIFFAEKVVLVEGSTEFAVIPFVASQLQVFRRSVTIIDCGGKNNIPLFMTLLNEFQIPYVVIHDEDPIMVQKGNDDHDRRKRLYECNTEIATLAPDAQAVRVLSPNFESIAGVSKSQGEAKGKPLAAIDHIESAGISIVLADLVKWAYR